jgi:hypothetical protein
MSMGFMLLNYLYPLFTIKTSGLLRPGTGKENEKRRNRRRGSAGKE